MSTTFIVYSNPVGIAKDDFRGQTRSDAMASSNPSGKKAGKNSINVIEIMIAVIHPKYP